MKSLTVLIPAYNEEKYIKSTTIETLNYLKKLNLNSFEIIVIPNGCTDDTEKIAKEISDKHKEVKCIVSEKGAGNAIKKGIEKASKDVITWAFADGEMDYSFIDRGLKLMDNYDLINGARFISSGKFGVHEDRNKGIKSHFFRRFLSRSCRLFAKTWIPLSISETGILKMFRKDWAQKNLKLKDQNWGIQSEILLQGGLDDLKITEIPISITLKRNAPDSRLNIKKETISLFKTIFKTGLILRLKNLFK